jgi:hypothetical protein
LPTGALYGESVVSDWSAGQVVNPLPLTGTFSMDNDRNERRGEREPQNYTDSPRDTVQIGVDPWLKTIPTELITESPIHQVDGFHFVWIRSHLFGYHQSNQSLQ